MRQVVLDTETTGLEPEQGHRIIEIGAVELIDRRRTEQHFHRYLNPEREIEEGALEVHGISSEFLSDKPRFEDIAEEFLRFLGDSELIIHNAPFDLGFLDYEFSLLGEGPNRFSGRGRVVDTLQLARDLRPGQRNSLDALCRHFEVDNSQRTLHGALLDAEILADVYLAMTGGQVAMALSVDNPTDPRRMPPGTRDQQRPPLRVVRANATELAAHREFLETIGRQAEQDCLWSELEDTA